MSEVVFLRVRKQPYPSQLPWFWYCRICTAHDFHESWGLAMRGAEVHYGRHWIKGKPGPMTLADIR